MTPGLVRQGLLAVALVGLALSVAGTAALDAGTTHRDASVGVAGADAAAVEVTVRQPAVGANGSRAGTTLVAVTNGLDEQFRVEAAVERTAGPPAVANVSTPGRLAPGESGAVRADVACTRPGEGVVTLRLHVSGDGFGASVTRQVDVACPGAG